MRRLFLSLLLPQMFLALSVGSAVTLCQTAEAFGIDLHAHEHFHAEHSHDDHEAPCEGEHCESLVSETIAPSLLKVPVEVAPIDLPPCFNVAETLKSQFFFASSDLSSEPAAPPSPPLPALTGCFLI